MVENEFNNIKSENFKEHVYNLLLRFYSPPLIRPRL